MAIEDTIKGRNVAKKKFSLKLTFKEITALEFDETQVEALKAFLANTRIEVTGFGRVMPFEFSLEEESAGNVPSTPVIRHTLAKDIEAEHGTHAHYYAPINISAHCTNPANPTQYEGTINGRVFYFRYLHGFWSLIIYQVHQGRPYSVEGLAGSREDSKMDENEVLTILRGCAHDCLHGRHSFKSQGHPLDGEEHLHREQDSFIY